MVNIIFKYDVYKLNKQYIEMMETPFHELAYYDSGVISIFSNNKNILFNTNLLQSIPFQICNYFEFGKPSERFISDNDNYNLILNSVNMEVLMHEEWNEDNSGIQLSVSSAELLNVVINSYKAMNKELSFIIPQIKNTDQFKFHVDYCDRMEKLFL